MNRVIAVVACGLALSGCSSWMPSFELPSMSMPSFGGGGAAGPVALAVESDPPGAQASAPGGASCVTPCRLNVTPTGPFSVNVALNGYVPQSVPVRIVQPDDPRLSSDDPAGGGTRLDPNPLYVELERAPPPPAAPPVHKKKKHVPVARQAAPAMAAAPQAAPAPASAPTTAVAPNTMAPPPAAAPQALPPSSSAAPWPMPR